MLLSERFPVLYPLSVAAHRTARNVEWLLDRENAAAEAGTLTAEHVIARHSSVIYRELDGVDMRLQENKRSNLELAIRTMDGRILRPGHELSFWRCIGEPSVKHGYLPGLVLENGHMAVGEGGGLCQLSNLLYWLVLHTPLEVTERHHHGYDVFPDSGRVLPFGSGATVFYNYVDLRFRNPTDSSFRLNLWIADRQLHGQLTSDRFPDVTYHVREEGHRFFKEDGRWFRSNRLYQVEVDRESGREVAVRLLSANRSPVMYEVREPVVAV